MFGKNPSTNINGRYLVAGLFLSIGAESARGDMINSDQLPPWEICAMCHGLDGNSHMSKFPKLAGQKPEYIAEQVKQFAQGHRRNDGGQMQSIVTEIEPAEIPGVAKYFSAQSPKLSSEYPLSEAGLQSKTLFNKGKKIFWRGKPAQPNCAQCHADNTTGAPWLHSQHQAYLIKQMDDFRTGARVAVGATSNSENWKSSQLNKLSEADLNAVSFYLANTDLNAVKEAVEQGTINND